MTPMISGLLLVAYLTVVVAWGVYNYRPIESVDGVRYYYPTANTPVVFGGANLFVLSTMSLGTGMSIALWPNRVAEIVHGAINIGWVFAAVVVVATIIIKLFFWLTKSWWEPSRECVEEALASVTKPSDSMLPYNEKFGGPVRGKG